MPTNQTPSEADLENVAELFKVFGDITRVRMLYVLYHGEETVGDLARALDMTPSAISHQLRTLKSARLVKSRREGRSIVYSLADGHIFAIFDQALIHIQE